MKARQGVPAVLFTPKGKRFRFSKARADDLRRLGLDAKCIALLEKHAIPACVPGKFDQLDGDGRKLMGSLAASVDAALSQLALVLYPAKPANPADMTAYEKVLERTSDIKALLAEASLNDADDNYALVASPHRAWEALRDLRRLLSLATPKKQSRRNAAPEPVLAIWHVLTNCCEGEHQARRALKFSIGEQSDFRQIVNFCYEAAGHPTDTDPVRAMNAAKKSLDAGAAMQASPPARKGARDKQ